MYINKSLQLLQITDTHLFSDDEKLMGLPTSDSLAAVIENVKLNMANGVIDPDLLLLTGDISQDFTVASYQKILKFFSDFTCPIHAILGNHDNSYVFDTTFSNSKINLTKKIIANNWLILMLNSHVPFKVSGHLSDDELSFLDEELAANKDKHVAIFVHHHLIPINAIWLNKISLENARQFFDVIDKYSNIVGVFCGHIHQDSHHKRNNVDYISTPSTCLQFAKNTKGFKLDLIMPGYRWFNFCDDGTYSTGVVRIAYDEKLLPDEKAKGY